MEFTAVCRDWRPIRNWKPYSTQKSSLKGYKVMLLFVACSSCYWF